jgi:twitching motility protein PilU
VDREKAIKYMHDLLRLLVKKNGSDLFITAGAVPSMKVDGEMKQISNQALSPQHTQVLVSAIMNDKQRAEFEETQEM